MELRHLRYFVAVAEEEHITRAAVKLGMQQPPLTHQIQLLEKELGVQLFYRQSRRIQLSPAGKLFLADARAILNNVEQSVLRVQRFEMGEEGSIRLGFTSSAYMHKITPNLVRTFREKFPLIAIEINEGSSHDLITAIEQEVIDIAFSRSSVSNYLGIHSVPLLNEDLILALPKNHPLCNALDDTLSLSDLANEDFVFYQQITGSGIKETLIEACTNVGFSPKTVRVVYRILGALHVVASGFGIAIVPKSLQTFQNDSIVYKTFHPASVLKVPLSLVYRENTSKLMVKKFLQHAHAYAQEFH